MIEIHNLRDLVQFLCFHYEARTHLENQKRSDPADYSQPIGSDEAGNEAIGGLLATATPFCAARMGSTELAIVDFVDRCRLSPKPEFNPLDRWLCFQSIKYRGWRGSGIFPPTVKTIDRFAALYTASLAHVDLLGVWYNHNEGRVITRYAQQAGLCDLKGLEPYYFKKPWSMQLGGKRVVVVHPFADSIERQFRHNRSRLFPGTDVLPDFELRVVPAIQSLLQTPAGIPDWFVALDMMKRAMEREPFDVAIIGAGAYGLPLAVHAKLLGAQAVHMAGATQILFGLRGKRWDEHPVISKLVNDSWTRPSRNETPASAGRVEGGCYW